MRAFNLPGWLLKLVAFATRTRRRLANLSSFRFDKLENRLMAGFLIAPTPSGVSSGTPETLFPSHFAARSAGSANKQALASAAETVVQRASEKSDIMRRGAGG